MIFGKQQGGADWLIAGLGNPEQKYEGTRHNAGFAALDALAQKWGIGVNKAKWNGLYGMGRVGEGKVVLVKPLTYMNLSGECVGQAARFYKIPPEHVIVLCDDIDQEPGFMRIRPEGSAGGHNGLKSIVNCLGSQNFVRIRMGVGKKPHPDYDLADWVLGHFGPAEQKELQKRFEDLDPACRLIMAGRLDQAQNKYNTRKPKPPKPPKPPKAPAPAAEADGMTETAKTVKAPEIPNALKTPETTKE